MSQKTESGELLKKEYQHKLDAVVIKLIDQVTNECYKQVPDDMNQFAECNTYFQQGMGKKMEFIEKVKKVYSYRMTWTYFNCKLCQMGVKQNKEDGKQCIEKMKEQADSTLAQLEKALK